MDPGDAGNGPQLLDHLGGNLDALRLRRVALQAIHAREGGVVDLDPRNVVMQVLEHPAASRRRHTDEQRSALGDPEADQRGQPLRETFDVVDDVALQEAHPGVELRGQTLRGVDQRVGGSDDPKRRRVAKRLAGRQRTTVHRGDEPGESPRVEIAHMGCAGVVRSDRERISGQDKDRAHPEHPRAEQIALHRHQVAVTSGDLKDRIDSLFKEQGSASKRRDLHGGRLIVGHVDSIDQTGEYVGRRTDAHGVGIPWRTEFSGDGEPAGG